MRIFVAKFTILNIEELTFPGSQGLGNKLESRSAKMFMGSKGIIKINSVHIYCFHLNHDIYCFNSIEDIIFECRINFNRSVLLYTVI